MEKIQLEVKAMSYSQSQTNAYALILGEIDGKRRLPIIIGAFEAHAIAIEIEKIRPARPLTHDLFKTFATAFKIKLLEVVINKFIHGVFHAELVCYDGNNEIRIDSRTSDAIALAIRFNCPIYTLKNILDEAGIVVEEESAETKKKTEKEQKKKRSDLTQIDIDELKVMLQEAIDSENYEKASLIRDEIKKRKGEET
ncbi:MAG: bifunctional nuclease domain-containing protein [Bacteroidales bacterium]